MHLNKKIQKRIVSDSNFTYRHIIKSINKYLKSSKKILDIGSGVGTLDFYLASRGHPVFGIDISRNAILTANKNIKIFSFKHKPVFKCISIENFKTESKFDFIIATEVLEHVKDDDKITCKIYKLLNKGGFFLCSSPSINAPLYRLGLLNKFDKEVGHLRRYSVSSYIRMLEKAGFKVCEVVKNEGIGRNILFTNKFAGNAIKILKGPFSDLATFVDYILVRLLGESNIILVAKKI